MTGPKILVVEDDANVRELIRAQLGLAGFDVHTARSGREGLARAAQLGPQGIILDINMPEMDGFQVLESLRGEMAERRPPVLVLTARHAAGDVRRALDLGAKDYLTKPFTETQLLARVSRLLRAPLSAPAPEPEPAREPDSDHVLLL
jgi:DNA-binding response OmpR family regulator